MNHRPPSATRHPCVVPAGACRLVPGLVTALILGWTATLRADMPPAAAAGGVRNLWFHQVPRLKTPPVLDGKSDDPCWQTLPKLTNFGRDRYPGDTKFPMVRMEMQLGFDQTYLYALWRIFDPGGQFKADFPAMMTQQQAKMYDLPMWWNPPSAEFRIDGRRDRQGETMVQMNLIGQRSAMQKIATGWSSEYTEGWEIWADCAYKPGFDESCWWMELKVALKDLGAEARPGYIMGAEFRYFHPTASFAWTPAGGDVGAFGDLLLVEEPMSMEKALEQICPEYRSLVIRMPQPDKVLVIERGQVRETSYKDTIVAEVEAVRQRRQELTTRLNACAGADVNAILAPVHKKFAVIDAELTKTIEFGATDLMRLQQPLDSARFALDQALAKVDIFELCRK